MLSQEKELPTMDRVPRDRGGIEPPGRLARVPTDPSIGLLQYRSAKVTHKAGFSPAGRSLPGIRAERDPFLFFFFCLNLEYDPESF